VTGVTLGELNSLFQIKDLSPSPSRPRPAPKGQSLYRKLLQCLLIQPELARRPELGALKDAGEDAELMAQVVEFVSACPQVVSTSAVIQQFASSPFDSRLAELEREVAPLGAEFDAEAEFVGALARLAEIRDGEARRRELDALHARNPDEWTPEERPRYRALVERSGRPGTSD
ncbi:MAG TPA: hypothetical protein VF104_13105, partial [Burkholderiales bacterium]